MVGNGQGFLVQHLFFYRNPCTTWASTIVKVLLQRLHGDLAVILFRGRGVCLARRLTLPLTRVASCAM